jgi:FG-GAP-like repeat
MFNRLFLIVSISLILWNCVGSNQSENYVPPTPSNKSGEELAQAYCSSCHQFPNPALLDKATWENGVLPKMAYRLGMEEDAFKVYGNIDSEELKVISVAGIYPAKPVLAKEDWAKIIKYYIDHAPEKALSQASKEKATVGLSNFSIKKLYGIVNKIPSVTLVKFNPSQKSIYVAWRGQQSFLKLYDLNLIQKDSLTMPSPVSDIDFSTNNSLRILTMGLMDPNDQSKGKLLSINSQKQTKTILESLQRPVQASFGDLNQDGKEDFVLCNFGNELGKLAWYEGDANIEHVLKMLPGARNTFIKDMNGDKRPDIVVLMTQAREGVFIFYNQGNGNFDEKQVLSFSSVYGSSYIDLADFNKDGLMDILYTNGDNADLSNSLKNYHGIRIFLNDGKGSFKQNYFYPMFGAAKAIAADFDLDGDLDIAAISFFTDSHQKPHEGFLLLDNQGNNIFKVSTFPEATQGKWMVMDVADMDADGDSDIILGSFLRRGMVDIEDLKMGKKLPPSAIILENKRK